VGLFLPRHRPQLHHGRAGRRLRQGQQDLTPVLGQRRHPGLRREDDVRSGLTARLGPGGGQEGEPGEPEVQVAGERPAQPREVVALSMAVQHEEVTRGAELHGPGTGGHADPGQTGHQHRAPAAATQLGGDQDGLHHRPGAAQQQHVRLLLGEP
jgi:hypothetical protein